MTRDTRHAGRETAWHHMLDKFQCAAVIPCLNEAAAIPALVREVGQQLRQECARLAAAPTSTMDPAPNPLVIVVDDGSVDDTAQSAKSAGAWVLRHPHPRGKGAALKTGLREAQRLGFRQALLLDGDGQHAPGDIPAFFHCYRQTQAQLIIGNRMSHAERMPWLRRMVNRWMSQHLSKLAGRPLPDSQCGFRMVELKTWTGLSMQAEHFEIESEMLLAFVNAGARIEFVPIQVIYRSERSKIHPCRDTWRWLRWLRQWGREGARRKTG